MLLPRSTSTAHASSRLRLFPLWSIALFALMTGVVLVLAFPQQWLLAQVQLLRPGDQVSLEYLLRLLQHRPDDPPLRLALARQYLASQVPIPAQQALEPLFFSNDPAIRTQAMALRYRSEVIEYLQLPADSPVRLARLHSIDLIRQHSPLRNDIESLNWIARQANGLSDDDLGLHSYERLATLDKSGAGRWLDAAARIAIARAEYVRAAGYYLSIFDSTADRAGRRHYFQAALRTLQAGNRLDAALDLASKRGAEFRDDPATLCYLIELARAANRLDAAHGYAIRLLGMHGLIQHRPGSGTAATPVSLKPPVLPFDDRAYSLGYEVFVAGTRLDDAYAVAKSAVRQAPQDKRWRKRLAQAAEWSSRPAEALAQWKILVQGNRDADAWQAIARLAPGLHDDAAILLLWRHRADAEVLSDADWQNLADQFDRAGTPRDGATYLRGHFAVRPVRIQLELAARLSRHGGDDAAALKDYQTLVRQYGPNPHYALNIADLYFDRGEPFKAWDALQTATPAATREDHHFWAMLSQLSWQTQQVDMAQLASRMLVEAGTQQAEDFQRLVLILQDSDPAQASVYAEQGWRQHRDANLFVSALELNAQAQQWSQVDRLFAALSPADMEKFDRIPYFWTMRAHYQHRRGRPALAIAAAEVTGRVALLWMLMQTGSQQALASRLQSWRTVARQHPSYWEAYAAGYARLNAPGEALQWHRRLLPGKGADNLWQMNYADALDQADQTRMAWRVRRQLWARRNVWLANPGSADATWQASLNEARLAMQFAPADLVATRLRQLFERAQASTADASQAQLDELLIPWLRASGDAGVAQAQPPDTFPGTAERFSIAMEQERIGSVKEQRNRLAGSFRLSPHWQLDLLAQHTRNTVTDQTLFPAVADLAPGQANSLAVPAGLSAHRREFGASLRRAGARGETRLAWRHSRAMSSHDGFLLDSEQYLGDGVTIRGALGNNQRATDSDRLREFGLRDYARFGLTLAADRNNHLTLSLTRNRFLGQHRTRLGTGTELDWAFTHRLRAGYPDYSIRLSGKRSRYSPRPAIALAAWGSLPDTPGLPAQVNNTLLPANSSLIGLNLSFGDQIKLGPARAWRPFADIGLSQRAGAGLGSNWQLGLAGSVHGRDHLSVHAGRNDDGNGTGQANTQFGLQYQQNF